MYDDFVSRLTAATAQLRIGEHQGPLINKAALEKVSGLVESAVAAGAEATIGGPSELRNMPPRGFFYPPTVLRNCDSGMACGCEEIFGPVAPVVK